uniref:NADPH oxidase organizer 1-like n=1 Tax=Gasterosteus aculeatus aculeatus TaxID=481459 RepID=UPI001A99C285|nr:NADPH oxidase organizer 1-like [Gasterosteus aculeatus aculeatus]
MSGERRFVFSARVIGAVHRDSPKLRVFMISVLWSDKAEVIVYRSFSDFKKLHKQLKKRFQPVNTLKKNERVIPKFRGQARRNSLQQKASQRCVQRMKFLETYCHKLLKCDHAVTQSYEATHFFLPNDHDLQADFTKNSIVMLLSDDVPDGAAVRRQHAASVTHPFVSQTHRCVAAYETKDTNNRPFKVAVDQELEVLIKDPAGWWLVEDEDKHLAWFPAPYLELWDQEGGGDDDDGDDGDDDVFPLAGALYCAVRSYSTKEEDEVSVPIGSVVEVLRKTDDGWWFIRFDGKSGYVPSRNLKPHNHPLHLLHRKLHSSTLNLTAGSDLQAPRVPRPRESPGQSRGGRLQKARSLDFLSETQSPSTSDGRGRSMSAETDFPSSSSSRPGGPAASLQPGGGGSGSPISVLSGRRGSSTGSDSSGSASSGGGETPSAAPGVPPRPKTEEILTRCSTTTRRAAMASRSRL